MAEPPKLLDRVREAIRVKHFSDRTEEAYVGWIRRFIVFHACRHPSEMGEAEVTAFVSALALRGVSASTQNQALSAVLFLYETVLGRRLPWMDRIVRAQRPVRLPVVLSRAEVSAVLSRLRGCVWLMASLMYGAGLRLQECCELRVKDMDLDRGELMVRDGKGVNLSRGCGSVVLPGSLAVKYPHARFEWAWQWVFPATRFYVDVEAGVGGVIISTNP